MGYKVLLVDDHKIVRDGLKPLVGKLSQIDSVSEAANGVEAIEKVKKINPDIVIMDIAMPDMNGIEATKKILEYAPKIKIIILSMHSNQSFIMEALKVGAKSYLLKENAFEELASAIKAVTSGQPYLSAKITDLVLQDYVLKMKKENCGSAYTLLSPREREVLKLLAEGKSSKIIASILNLSLKTIEAHRQQIMSKLNIHSIAELTKYAIREGLTLV